MENYEKCVGFGDAESSNYLCEQMMHHVKINSRIVSIQGGEDYVQNFSLCIIG